MKPGQAETLERIAAAINERKGGDPAKSYVARLFAQGDDAMLKKIGEEATETVLAAKSGDRLHLVREVTELWFHCMIVLARHGVGPGDVLAEMQRREGISGIDVSKSLLDRIHTPTLYILGGETDIAYANGMDDVSRIKHVPAYVGNLIGVGHGGSYWQPNGGKAAAAVVAWLDWQLRGDKSAAKTFVGKDCGLCTDPAWQFRASR